MDSKNRIIPAQDTVASERTSFQWPAWMPFSQLTASRGGKQLKSPQGLVPKKTHPFWRHKHNCYCWLLQASVQTAGASVSTSPMLGEYCGRLVHIYTYAYLEHMLCTDKGLTVKMFRDQINVFSKTSTGNGLKWGWVSQGIWFSSASIQNKSSVFLLEVQSTKQSGWSWGWSIWRIPDPPHQYLSIL